MTKDARLTLRITDELDVWLGAEAAKRGLDKAAFARMSLFERMNGTAPQIVEPRAAAPTRDVLVVGTTSGPGAAISTVGPMAAPDGQLEPSEPVDIDHLVDQQFGEAEAAGLLDAPQPDPGPTDSGGVRALMRPAPRFTMPLPSFVGGA